MEISRILIIIIQHSSMYYVFVPANVACVHVCMCT